MLAIVVAVVTVAVVSVVMLRTGWAGVACPLVEAVAV